MPLDGFSLAGIVHECNKHLLGGRISKIYQPLNDEVNFLIYNKGNNYRLVISANAQNSRVCLSEQEKDNPIKPPMFCMLLRKHLEGGKITNIEQPELERIIKISVQCRDELGNSVEKLILAEIMGRHSNIMLLSHEDMKIIDAIKRVPWGVSSYRQVLPGLKYRLPPEFDKKDPLGAEARCLAETLTDSPSVLVDNYKGVSPLLAEELLYRTGKPARAIELLQNTIKHKRFEPCICRNDRRAYFSAILLTHLNEQQCQMYTTVNGACDAFYSGKEDRAAKHKVFSHLNKIVKSNLDRASSKLSKQRQAYGQAMKADHYKRIGDLIKANLHQIPHNQSQVEVVDYFDETLPTIIIELDANKTPQQNLQIMFSKYEKAIRSQKALKRYIRLTKAEINYLNSLQWTLNDADTLDELEEIASELKSEGYLKTPNQKKGATDKKTPSNTPREFRSSDNLTILVGRNNRQNDLLTMRMANKDDIWLHTKEIPGSHVIIRQSGRDIPKETIQEAAMLAAFFSKARLSSNVPVDYTLVKHVRKPKGAKPGMVIYDNQQTLYVTPQKDLVQELRSN